MSILNIDKLKTMKQSSIVTKYFQQPWLLTLHIICTVIILLCNSCSSWIIVNDLNEQIKGLVYDKISKYLTGYLILFNIIELTFSIIELFLWLNLLKKQLTLWIIIDCITIMNIYLAELPLNIMNIYICACHDTIISIGFIIKGFFILIFICLRLSICFISCNYEKTNEFTKNSFNINLNEEQYLLHNNNNNNNNNNENNFLNEKFLCKSIYWTWIRIILCTGLICLIVLICTIFSFALIQLNVNNLKWYQFTTNQTSNYKVVTFQHDYLHDVEIFLEDNSNQSQIKWYHLLSLEQIIQLKQINANESVILSLHHYNKQKFIRFKQIIHYSNKTKLHWSSCWQIIKYDLYKEIVCPLLRNQSIRLIYGIKITFIYIEPSKRQLYGNVLYNMTRVITGSRKIRQHDIKLKYFQNTIVHLSSKKSTELQSNHGHDEWSSGPFRSYNLHVDDQLYTKYRSTDLVPVQELWKTGIAKCQSTAPIGPEKI
ncbi:hypothetical protein MN116_005749 [Schistosoma mekongi]|uniref:Transmembrane protein n=1 Tax=Schistosoma mekongi TaxID=38744 RepID=A0AAE2D3J0_SCHME|nr:hypothetical protein MN116_005749 [Schistosoma mekongi]